MLRTKRYLKLGALAAVIAVLGSCVLIVDSNGGSLFTDIQVGTEYTGQSIGANESNYYAFVAGSNPSGVHNIAVSSMTTSTDWYLYESQTSATTGGTSVQSSENAGTANDTANAQLTPGKTYYLVVKEKEGKTGSYTLNITN